MNENIIVEFKGDYVHARQYGPDSYDASLELWRRIMTMCEQNNCFNILGENFVTKPLTTMEAYDHITIFKDVGVTFQHRIAWVHHIEETAEPVRFMETVLLNRGLVNGQLFPTVDEAKKWLLGDRSDNKSDPGDA